MTASLFFPLRFLIHKLMPFKAGDNAAYHKPSLSPPLSLWLFTGSDRVADRESRTLNMSSVWWRLLLPFVLSIHEPFIPPFLLEILL